MSSLAQIILKRQFSFLRRWVKTDRQTGKEISGIKIIEASFSSLSLFLCLSSLPFPLLSLSYLSPTFLHSLLSFLCHLSIYILIFSSSTPLSLSCPFSYFSLFPLFSVPSACNISSLCIFFTLFCHILHLLYPPFCVLSISYNVLCQSLFISCLLSSHFSLLFSMSLSSSRPLSPFLCF